MARQRGEPLPFSLLSGPDQEIAIRKALAATSGGVSRAARRIGISRPFFWYYLRQLGLERVPRNVRAAAKGAA